MAGEAKTTNFMAGSFTVMLGTRAETLSLNPAAHSIGLTKGVSVSSESTVEELTQGLQNSVVASFKSGAKITLTAEVYEITKRNLAFGLSQDGTLFPSVPPVTYPLQANIAALATTLTLATDLTPQFAIGDFIRIAGLNDHVYISRLSAAPVFASGNTTLTFIGSPVPVAMLAANTRIGKVVPIHLGSNEESPFFAAKIVGVLQNNQQFVMTFPSVRILTGFNLTLASTFGQMPFEITPYPVLDDHPLFADPYFQSMLARTSQGMHF